MSVNTSIKFMVAMGLAGISIVGGSLLVVPRASATTTSSTTLSRCLNETTSKAAISVTGLTATATFTVPEACGSQKISLVSYKAPAKNGRPFSEQTVYRYTTQVVMPGSYTWTVQVPDCFYQVDLVQGDIITTFSDTVTYHGQNRFLAAKNAGDKECVEPVTPVTPVNPSPTAPAALPNAGPGDVLTLAAVTAVVATLLHANRRKLLHVLARTSR